MCTLVSERRLTPQLCAGCYRLSCADNGKGATEGMRLTVLVCSVQSGAKEQYYKGTIDAWQKIYRDEGRKVRHETAPDGCPGLIAPHGCAAQTPDSTRRLS